VFVLVLHSNICREGLRVSLGFFSDVLIPDYALQSPSLYNHEEGVWVWKYDGSDMFMDIGASGSH
jgi:DNA-directed RNA polymerase III subunit RPC8